MIKKLYTDQKNIFIFTFIAVIIIHGTMLFHKISWHDDLIYTDGYPFMQMKTHGRWLFDWIWELQFAVCRNGSLPLFNGMAVAFSIAFMTVVVMKMCSIENQLLKIALALIFSSLPAVAGHLGYMTSAPIDFIGKLLCVFGGYIIFWKDSWKTRIVSCILFACSIGEYQCYVSFFITVLLTIFIREVLNKDYTWNRYLIYMLKSLGTVLASLILYLCVMQISLKISALELSSYAGINTYGIVSLREYIERIIFAYSDFFVPTAGPYTMFPFHWKAWHRILIFAGITEVIVINIWFIRKKKGIKCVQADILYAMVPFAFNFNFVLYGAGAAHSLHMYHYIFLFAILAMMAEYIKAEAAADYGIKKLLFEKSVEIAAVICSIFAVLYIQYDNACYTFNQIRQESAISYFTVLSARIQSLEGYNPSAEIVYLNDRKKFNYVDGYLSQYEAIVTNPYDHVIVNDYNWIHYMEMWCGFYQKVIDGSKYENMEEVLHMPSYPEDGSIKMIDGVIVVKF